MKEVEVTKKMKKKEKSANITVKKSRMVTVTMKKVMMKKMMTMKSCTLNMEFLQTLVVHGTGFQTRAGWSLG